MKNNYFFKRTLSAVVLLMVSSLMWADDFEVDRIAYDILSETEVSVTSKKNKYEGQVVIPSTVNYGDKTYSVTSIGYAAFSNCSSLTSIEIPNSMTSIGDYAFNYCSSLISVEIPNSVTRIGHGAFIGCSSLTSIEIPSSVTRIEGEAFNSCYSLASIIVADDNSVYDSREGCNAIIETASNTLIKGCHNTVIPNSVTSIGDNAFQSCYLLTSVEIGNSVTSIGDNAFQNCYLLTSVEIGNSVTSIGDYAFQNCDLLTSVICYAEDVPELDRSVFSGVPQNEATLYVPASALEAYKGAYQWKEFGTILPIDEDATGIASTTAEQETDATYYTLDGVSVKNPTKKGIYIKNGKKVYMQ